jgi:hypothetical protein
MPYYVVTVLEQKEGARRRRKLAIASASKAHAVQVIQEMCKGTDFMPDYNTVGEVGQQTYAKVMATFLGRKLECR